MKVIICGAGQVGVSIARYLATEDNEVTIVDHRPEPIRAVVDTLDVQAVVGHASLPGVLEQAGAADAEIVIAATRSDETNMVACQIAHALFNVPTKIARIRNQDYLAPHWADLFSRENMPIDVTISPEIEVAEAIARRLKVPGALDVIELADGLVRLVGVRLTESTPVVFTPLRQLTQLFPDLSIIVVAIVRNGRAMVPSADDQMLPGDEAYFVLASSHTRRALALFGHEEPQARRLLILGAGNVGMFLTKSLARDFPRLSWKMVEVSPERAKMVARELHNASPLLVGDVLDPDILREAGVEQAETVIAVTNDDETNVLSSLLAKHCGATRAITLLNKSTYNALVGSLNVDVVVNPRSITVSRILQHVRRGRVHSVHPIYDGFGELIEADALETSPLVGKPLRDINLPAGVILGALVREGETITPCGTTVIQPGDRIILFASAASIRKVERFFSVGVDFF
ncbi:Trk system potassium transporter TrkA [Phaeovibrio sulfidiphilus]|uniref:Trk system potassium uptake protein TrkA n=1 Tax=Phaeovibrio sulfidiphilus TaxID=1220600 RepID=A0A8J6YNE3_9PROT|nr:Trk system potassium transporter TrkA [Phaeovibrio sulfidiphilus]MBE1237715.1 Trk system potassium transporter TrkA [Phaeovibrio sulfidiphilus]